MHGVFAAMRTALSVYCVEVGAGCYTTEPPPSRQIHSAVDRKHQMPSRTSPVPVQLFISTLIHERYKYKVKNE